MFVFNDLMTWYIPSIIANHRPTLILFGAVLGFFVGLRLKNSLNSVKVRLRQISPIVLFVIIYVVFLVYSSTTTAYDQIGDRLLSPIYIPLTLLFLILTHALGEPYRGQFSNKIVNSFLIIVLVIWLVYPIRYTIINAVNFASVGQGYSSKAWRESQTVQYLLQHQTLESECTIYTNAPEAAYILANLATKKSPAKTSDNWLIQNNKVCLVWFDKVSGEYLLTIDELKTVANINLISGFDDGAIYSVTQK
jgi:hypothetical protein